MYNVYAFGKNGERLRAVSIADYWRITKYNDDKDVWIFLDNVKYSSAYYALLKYI